jgi:hypothetical protein
MCLTKAKAITDSKLTKGYGYKNVKLKANGDMKGSWPYFRSGAGGLSGREVGASRNTVTWKIGRMYRVKHYRTTLDEDGKEYPAGVHVWKTTNQANLRIRSNEVTIVCRYTSATHQDYRTVVARRVTPLLVLHNREEVKQFTLLTKEMSIPDAILVWKNRI